MNKTYNINLAGQIFHINEDAFDALSDYLKSLSKIYQNEEGGNEIITDIEARIAEIFLLENRNNIQTIINVQQVENVILTLGKPEQHYSEEIENEPIRPSQTSSNKKMFRDNDSKIIAGVCSGLSHYFGISDPLWMRLIFLVLFFGGFGGSLLIYIVLWILLPKAITSSEKLQMKGEAINIGNIEKTVKDGIQSFKDSFQELDNKSKIQKVANKSTSLIQSILLFIFQIIKAFLLFIFIIIFGVLVFASFILGIVTIAGTPALSKFVFENSFLAYSSSIALITMLIITSLFFILLPIHIFSNDKKPLKKPVGISMAIIGLAAFFIFIIGATDTARQFATSKSIQNEEVLLQETLKDTIVIATKANPNTEDNSFGNIFTWRGQFEINDEQINSNFVKVNLAQSPDQNIHIFKVQSSRGKSNQAAIENARKIDYQYSRNGDTLIFNDYISMSDKTTKFRNQSVEITLYIPEGKVIIFDNSQDIIHKKPRIKDFDNDEYFDLGSTPWKLEGGYLIPLSSSISSSSSSNWSDITPMEGFSKIEIDGLLDAEIIYSTQNKIESNHPNDIKIQTTNNKVSLSRTGRNINGKTAKVKIYTSNLSDVDIDGMSKAIISNFNTNNIDIDVSGSSSVSFNNCNFQQLTADIDGMSMLQGFSKIENAIINIDGMSEFNGDNLIIQNLKAEINGASKATVNVQQKLKGSVNGISKLEYIGKPITDVTTSGNSTIKSKI